MVLNLRCEDMRTQIVSICAYLKFRIIMNLRSCHNLIIIMNLRVEDMLYHSRYQNFEFTGVISFSTRCDKEDPGDEVGTSLNSFYTRLGLAA